MRFALLGDHPDGLDMACALVASGRHQLLVYSGPVTGMQALQRFGHTPESVGDLEEVLANPDIDAVIVASGPVLRPPHLRRAIQSECHVVAVHPADPSPDIAYEAALIQADTGRVLLPLLPMAFHPGIARLATLTQGWQDAADTIDGREQSPTIVRLLELEVCSTEEVLLEVGMPGHKPSFPGWDVLRFLGGEIGEVFLLSTGPELLGDQPCLMTGRFLTGVLLQASYLPNQAESSWRVSLVTPVGRATLHFARGWPGPAQLTYVDEQGTDRTELYETFHPWPMMVERLEQAVLESIGKKPQPGQLAGESWTKSPPRLGWQDELRALELDDAVRRSLERGRSSALEFQEAVEEASFKGTMTLVGCSLIWLSLIVLLVSVWVPWLVWGIVPVFGLFLVLQVLRWIVPAKQPAKEESSQ